jgi:hypothetical protein
MKLINKISLYQDIRFSPVSDDELSLPLSLSQAEGEDPLSVGLPDGRAAELPKPFLQQCLREDTPCSGAFHPALPLQVSAS